MPESTHTTPDGTPMIEALGVEMFGALAIEPAWFDLPESETLVPDGESITTNLLMYGEDGKHAKRVRVRLVIEEVSDADD